MDKQYGQAGRPTGLIGRLLGQIMARHNRIDNDWTLELLGIRGGENILEIGYGPGRAIQRVHALYPECRIAGVDHSEEMFGAASRLNRDAIAAGAVDLRLGGVEAVGFADCTFDKAFSINSIYFWPDAVGGLRELYRVLKDGGKLAITVRDKQREAYRAFSRERLHEMLLQGGFSDVQIVGNGFPSHPLLCGVGVK